MPPVYSFAYSYRTMVLCVCGLIIFFPKHPKRKYWQVILAAGLAVYVLFVFCYTYFFDNFFRNENVFLASSTYIIQYVFITVIAFACLENNFMGALFCSTTAYTLEQLVSRICGLIGSFYIGTDNVFLYDMISAAMVTVASCTAAYFIILWKKGKRNREIKVVKPVQLLITVLVVAVMIFIEQAAAIEQAGGQSALEGILSYISSILFAFVVLALEYNMLSRKEATDENKLMKSLMAQEREQYEFKKSLIDTINIKAHDLKHQVRALKGRVLPDELQKIEQAVELYDASKKTGNTALDVVLNSQSLICENKGIEFTCMADGAGLSFMSDSDVYSLFSNILDNAVEAVMQVGEPEKRAVALTVLVRDGNLYIHEENYCNDKEVKFVNGLPRTTKNDAVYHGFGVKSIIATVKSYSGDCKINVDDGIFSVDITIPV